MRVLPIGLCVLALSAVGCVDPDVGRDRDGDGFRTSELDGDDCDDANPNINPAASEACGNGVDDNCDGVIDDVGVGQVDWYVDNDGDGFPSDTVFQSCSPPAGTFADLTRGVDCDDNNNTINPGADEIYYDGVDQDCAGGDDNDADGDGHPAVAQGGDDCDDADALVSPSADEVCNNGVDDDCDGGPGPCEYRGEVVVEDVAEVVLPYFGRESWWVDLTEDGVLDFVLLTLGSDSFDPDRLRVFDGATLTSNSLPLATYVFDAGGGTAHANIDGDFNDDGVPDLVLWNEDGAYVYESPHLGGSFTSNFANHRLTHDTVRLTHVAAMTDMSEEASDHLALFGRTSGFNAAGLLWTLQLVASDYDLADESSVTTEVVVGGPSSMPGDGRETYMVEGSVFPIGNTVAAYYNLVGLVPPVVRRLATSVVDLEPILFGVSKTQSSTWDSVPHTFIFPVGWIQSRDDSFLSGGIRIDASVGVSSFGDVTQVDPLAEQMVSDDNAPSITRFGHTLCDVNGDGAHDMVVGTGVIPRTGVAVQDTRTELFYSVETMIGAQLPDASFGSTTQDQLVPCGCSMEVQWVCMSTENPPRTNLLPMIAR